MKSGVKRTITHFKYKCTGFIVYKSSLKKHTGSFTEAKYSFHTEIYLFLGWREDVVK